MAGVVERIHDGAPDPQGSEGNRGRRGRALPRFEEYARGHHEVGQFGRLVQEWREHDHRGNSAQRFAQTPPCGALEHGVPTRDEEKVDRVGSVEDSIGQSLDRVVAPELSFSSFREQGRSGKGPFANRERGHGGERNLRGQHHAPRTIERPAQSIQRMHRYGIPRRIRFIDGLSPNHGKRCARRAESSGNLDYLGGGTAANLSNPVRIVTFKKLAAKSHPSHTSIIGWILETESVICDELAVISTFSNQNLRHTQGEGPMSPRPDRDAEASLGGAG